MLRQSIQSLRDILEDRAPGEAPKRSAEAERRKGLAQAAKSGPGKYAHEIPKGKQAHMRSIGFVLSARGKAGKYHQVLSHQRKKTVGLNY